MYSANNGKGLQANSHRRIAGRTCSEAFLQQRRLRLAAAPLKNWILVDYPLEVGELLAFFFAHSVRRFLVQGGKSGQSKCVAAVGGGIDDLKAPLCKFRRRSP